ncbi:HNH endonuclease [Streptomyces sp. KL116D]|uniref:HNH endonuclease n=1 Tax=Streptomyces sp. KL116D TaxID=3045152 RepID=UPI003558D00B
MAVSKRLRYEILRRDNHACRYCGATAPDAKLNVDHVIPQSLGGTDKPDNLVTSCAECNSGKTSSLPNAMPVADVDQDAFRQAVERRQVELTEHLWRGGYPWHWGREEIECHAADAAWGHAWSIVSKGGSPSHDQYIEFLAEMEALFENGRSVGEVVCAAAYAGSQLTPRLSWGLGVMDLQYVPVSGEQYSRMADVYERWLEVWRERRADGPTDEQVGEFRGRLILGARSGYSRDELLRGARSAAFAGSTDVDYFAYHVACEDADERVGEV